jgi:hypothetical protein
MHDYTNSPILISGIQRSGSSMVAGVINICGAFSGTMSGANKLNGRGVCENDKIHDEIVAPYLKELGVDVFCQYPLPNTEKLNIPANWNKRVLNALREDGYKGGPWMYKSSKSCLLWPIWHYAFPNAKWLIVRRRTGDIIRSCQRTNFMSAFKSEDNQKMVYCKSEQDGWKWWIHQQELRFVSMIEGGLNVKIVWPERMVSGDYSQLYEAVLWCNLSWKSEVFNFIDPKLGHARKTNTVSSINSEDLNALRPL